MEVLAIKSYKLGIRSGEIHTHIQTLNGKSRCICWICQNWVAHKYFVTYVGGKIMILLYKKIMIIVHRNILSIFHRNILQDQGAAVGCLTDGGGQ